MHCIKEAIEVHDKLNNKIWNGTKLRKEVRDKILEIVSYFTSELEIELPVLDIYLVGSNASYNYTDKSDLDVHIITNFNLLDSSEEILQAYYRIETSNFNKNYNVSIHGVDIELYIEDVESSAVSNGIYSIYKEEWIKFPEPIDIDEFDTSKDVIELSNEIRKAIASNSFDNVKNELDKIYLMRKESIANEGEYGYGNQLFKDLRNLGLIDKLKEKYKEFKSEELTLENLSAHEAIMWLNRN